MVLLWKSISATKTPFYHGTQGRGLSPERPNGDPACVTSRPAASSAQGGLETSWMMLEDPQDVVFRLMDAVRLLCDCSSCFFRSRVSLASSTVGKFDVRVQLG